MLSINRKEEAGIIGGRRVSEERRKEILLGIMELMEEYNSLDISVDFPEVNYAIHISLEHFKNFTEGKE